MRDLLRRNWFTLLLVLLIAIGIGFSSPLSALSEMKLLRYAVVFSVMFLMAWSLELRHVWNSCKQPLAPLLASLLNLGLMPLLAWPLSWLFGSHLALGIIATAATPCTLATAAVWTRRGGGNEVVALMTTLITNSICFLVAPLWIHALANGARLSGGGNFLSEMVLKLFLLIILPIALAQLTRIHRPLANWAVRQKKILGGLAQLGILLMVLLGSVQMGLSLAQPSEVNLWYWLPMSGLAMGLLHFTVLLLGFGAAGALRREPGEKLAVALSGSQKSFMVGLTICLEIEASILPLLFYHSIQLIGDAWVADRYRQKHFADAPSPRSDDGDQAA